MHGEQQIGTEHSGSPNPRFEPKSRNATNDGGDVLLDHTSKEGPTVTHVKGILLVNAIANLKEWGVFDRYCELLPGGHEKLYSVIAASWVDIQSAVTHYDVASQLGIEDELALDAGDRLGSRIGKTLMGVMLRGASAAGLDAFGFVLRRNDRNWDRLYRGGGTMLRKLGHMDMVIEDFGNPLVQFDLFRLGYYAYWRAIARLCTRHVELREAKSIKGRDYCFATHFTWR